MDVLLSADMEPTGGNGWCVPSQTLSNDHLSLKRQLSSLLSLGCFRCYCWRSVHTGVRSWQIAPSFQITWHSRSPDVFDTAPNELHLGGVKAGITRTSQLHCDTCHPSISESGNAKRTSQLLFLHYELSYGAYKSDFLNCHASMLLRYAVTLIAAMAYYTSARHG